MFVIDKILLLGRLVKKSIRMCMTAQKCGQQREQTLLRRVVVRIVVKKGCRKRGVRERKGARRGAVGRVRS